MTGPAFDTTDVFDEDYLYFYAERTGDERSEAETELIWRLLELEPDMEVLDLACGHGRIANRLAARGCRVTGLDATPLFLRKAREDAAARGVSVDYHLGDMRDLPWPSRFDRVLNWFTSFGYFDDSGNRQVLAEVYRVLRAGGRFALELNHLPWLLRNMRPTVLTERDGNLLIDRNEFDSENGRMLSLRTVVRDGQRRDMRFFTRLCTFPELRHWLHECGFATVHGYDENGAPLTLTSRRMIAVATRCPSDAPAQRLQPVDRGLVAVELDADRVAAEHEQQKLHRLPDDRHRIRAGLDRHLAPIGSAQQHADRRLAEVEFRRDRRRPPGRRVPRRVTVARLPAVLPAPDILVVHQEFRAVGRLVDPADPHRREPRTGPHQLDQFGPRLVGVLVLHAFGVRGQLRHHDSRRGIRSPFAHHEVRREIASAPTLAQCRRIRAGLVQQRAQRPTFVSGDTHEPSLLSGRPPRGCP